MDFVPDVSAIKTDVIEVDRETIDMLSALGMSDLPGLLEVAPRPAVSVPAFGRGVAVGGGGSRRY
ncbi:hypothetical protein RND81_04G130400 [Saponaria officinalis]|uniref:Uncharacterized protein n=1 Tax=Saponaria officinalis TaxID=3572 RepID=A0AAW1LL79_SAPOF